MTRCCGISVGRAWSALQLSTCVGDRACGRRAYIRPRRHARHKRPRRLQRRVPRRRDRAAATRGKGHCRSNDTPVLFLGCLRFRRSRRCRCCFLCRPLGVVRRLGFRQRPLAAGWRPLACFSCLQHTVDLDPSQRGLPVARRQRAQRTLLAQVWRQSRGCWAQGGLWAAALLASLAVAHGGPLAQLLHRTSGTSAVRQPSCTRRTKT